jgi:uncharacterized protein (TIGR02246 family)
MHRAKQLGWVAHAFPALILLALVAWPSAAWSRAPRCVHVTERQIADLFERWNDALKTGNAGKVVALYTSDAVLLPTLKNGPLVGHPAISEYFEDDFLPKKPSGAINGKHNIRIGCNMAVDAGLYTFTFGKPDLPPAEARYTYVYKYDGRRWLIVHHHSSVRPEPTKPKP